MTSLRAASLLLLLLASFIGTVTASPNETTWQSLQNNVLSYLILVIPAALFIRYFRQHPDVIKSNAEQINSDARYRTKSYSRSTRLCIFTIILILSY